MFSWELIIEQSKGESSRKPRFLGFSWLFLKLWALELETRGLTAPDFGEGLCLGGRGQSWTAVVRASL